jgi:dethiobiotin synthetase
VVEGAGGALVPLGDGRLYADQFAAWGLPVVLVARTGLGTINHTLLTIEALRARGCVVAGLAFVGEAHAENEAFIPAYASVPRLGRLPILPQLDPQTLGAAMAGFDLEALA